MLSLKVDAPNSTTTRRRAEGEAVIKIECLNCKNTWDATRWTVETCCTTCKRGFTVPYATAPRDVGPPLTDEQVSCMRWALGVDEAEETHRNRFFSDPYHRSGSETEAWRDLVSRGFARQIAEPTPSLPYHTFEVTEAGVRALLRAWKPAR